MRLTRFLLSAESTLLEVLPSPSKKCKNIAERNRSAESDTDNLPNGYMLLAVPNVLAHWMRATAGYTNT